MLASGLTEEMKWGVPCYTLERKNVVLISALKDHCVVSFFKGELMADPYGLLEKPGPNAQTGRVVRLASVEEIARKADPIQDYIAQAIALEKAGARAASGPGPGPMPEEWLQALEANPAVGQAFAALTPGRQRGYILYFSEPKQSRTRLARIEKCLPRILRGEGLHDRT